MGMSVIDTIRNRSVATRIVDQIVEEITDRVGVDTAWGAFTEATRSEIRDTCIRIATAELNESEE